MRDTSKTPALVRNGFKWMLVPVEFFFQHGRCLQKVLKVQRATGCSLAGGSRRRSSIVSHR